MKRTTLVLPAVLAVASLLTTACADKPAGGTATTAAPAATTAAPTATATATAAPTATATATASAEPSSDATDAPSAEPAPTKKYDCGARHQKPCPMQGWMKKVMAPASGSGDGAKLAEALEYVAKRPPPGYAEWTKLAKEGAAKAKAGDIDGAKQSCKKCHDAYKSDYKATMRDRAW